MATDRTAPSNIVFPVILTDVGARKINMLFMHLSHELGHQVTIVELVQMALERLVDSNEAAIAACARCGDGLGK